MHTLVVIFFGLLIHVNQPWSLDNTVVIPYLPDHKAMLTIPAAAVDETLAEHHWLAPYRSGDAYAIPLTGRKFRIERTRGYFCDKRPNFFSAAPSLHALAPRCRLRSEVRERKTTSDLIAYVDYRGGRVTPASYFSRRLYFASTASEWKERRCVTCSVRYEADLEGDHADLLFSDRNVIHIRGNSEIVVSNLPVQADTPDDGPAGPVGHAESNHFHAHFSIYEAGCHAAEARFDDEDTCRQSPQCPPPAANPFPDADCTNTNHP